MKKMTKLAGVIVVGMASGLGGSVSLQASLDTAEQTVAWPNFEKNDLKMRLRILQQEVVKMSGNAPNLRAEKAKIAAIKKLNWWKTIAKDLLKKTQLNDFQRSMIKEQLEDIEVIRTGLILGYREE